MLNAKEKALLLPMIAGVISAINAARRAKNVSPLVVTQEDITDAAEQIEHTPANQYAETWLLYGHKPQETQVVMFQSGTPVDAIPSVAEMIEHSAFHTGLFDDQRAAVDPAYQNYNKGSHHCTCKGCKCR